jgi:rubredoxin
VNHIFQEKVTQAELPHVLIKVYKKYQSFLNTSTSNNSTNTNHTIATKNAIIPKNLYQCPKCSTVYDAMFGDEAQGIVAGVPFEELSARYCCAICETNKSEFVAV